MEFVYNAIIERFGANHGVFESAGISRIRHFDLFKNQYVEPELHHAYKKPAIFYEWSAAWRDVGHKVQEGDLSIRIHLELENYGQSFHYSSNKSHALQIFEYQKRANALLLGLAGEGFTALRRVATEPDLNPTQTNVTVMSYASLVVDGSALELEEAGLARAPLDDMASKLAKKKPPGSPGGYYTA